MWFQFPEGTTSITVQQQTFSAEVRSDDGREFFRAPDHFAALILDLPGFKAGKPETDIPDLPQADPERDTAITRLSSQVTALTQERDAALANLKPLQEENVKLRKQVAELEANANTSASADAKTDAQSGAKK